MKLQMSVTMTKEEKNKMFNYLSKDPCDIIDCGDVACENCPFNKITDRMNEVRNEFMQLLYDVAVVEND